MESETESFMSILSAFVLEQVLLEIFHDGEQGTTGGVGRGILAVRTCNPPGQCRYKKKGFGRLNNDRYWRHTICTVDDDKE